MSTYGHLACEHCHQFIWLGKAVRSSGGQDKGDYFAIGTPESRADHDKALLNAAVWKFLAAHSGHTLRVLVEGTPEHHAFFKADCVEIGGDGVTDIPLEKYLQGWCGSDIIS